MAPGPRCVGVSDSGIRAWGLGFMALENVPVLYWMVLEL